jgi:hypothetical protein
MLLIYEEEQNRAKLAETERGQIMSEYMQFGQAIRASGQFQAGTQLQPIATATAVRVRGGKRLVTDGPFAETREQLGGFYLIEAKDLDEAVALAARIPSARLGTVEVRPLVQAAVPAPA